MFIRDISDLKESNSEMKSAVAGLKAKVTECKDITFDLTERTQI